MEKRSRTAMVRLMAVLAVLALALGAVACGGDDDDSSSGGGGSSSGTSTQASSDSGSDLSGKKVYLNAYAKVIQYFRDWHEGATAEAKKLGASSVDQDYGNFTPEQQVSQVQSALVKRPDVILVTPIDEKSLEPVLRQAKDQGAKVITIGATVADDSLVDSFVARENYDLGVTKAQWVIDQLGNKGKVGIVHGIRGLTFSEEQKKGYADTLKKSNLEVVDGPFAGAFSSDKGLDVTQNMLTKNPDLNAIIYDNDDLAIGGIQAAKERNIPMDKILIVGTDGGSAALKVVEKGDLDMTMSLCGYKEGISGIDTAVKALQGSAPKRVVSHIEMFTPDNIKEKQSSMTREDCA
jgi:ABC-type sugar transport system substrate-binding protein